ncbi:MAG: histidine kinase [Tannerellaceae bacterium]|nr:histidine kinase [Tannerellaceae bacterium]
MKRCLFLYILLLPFFLYGQEEVKKRSVYKSNSAVSKLSSSLEQNVSNDSIAADYEKVAREFIVKKDYIKAEDYLKRARQTYERSNNKEKRAYMEREIAKVQEMQENYTAAIVSFRNASHLSSDAIQKELNNNDIKRLLNLSNPRSQVTFVQRNIDILNTSPTQNKEDRVQAYSQMAEINYRMDNKEVAVSNLQSALEVAEEPSQALQVQRRMADVYASENRMDEAIGINEEILKKATEEQDTKVQIEQLQTLSNVYIENKEVFRGITSLQQAYDLALKEGRTLDAKKSLELLVAQYRKENNNRRALDTYAGFMNNLESLLKADSSLIDEKVFIAHEEKIAQLEKERLLKDELIRKKNITNSILTGSIILILLFLLLIAKALYSIKRKNKKIALQSLRREMNPHFIFNSLNSVNQFIAQNNELEANKYLSSYSKLMRNIMENSNKDFTPLSTELEQLKEYLELEHMRFHDKFTYQITIDAQIDTDATHIPNMLIQPQIENAIWHGLRYREKDGLLLLHIKKEGNQLIVSIEDNGIGREKSQEIKTKHQKEHQSRGLTNTYERINLLNSLYNSKITVTIIDKEGEESGVIVLFRFP